MPYNEKEGKKAADRWEREGQYNDLLYYIAVLEDHRWGKRIPKRDSRMISLTLRRLKAIANELYNLRQYSMRREGER